MPYLDFDTLVICNNNFSEDFLLDCFSFFRELGIRNFIFTYDLDIANRSPAEGLRTLRTLKPYLHRFQLRDTRIYTAANILLDQDVARNQDLLNFTLPHTDRIFVSLPIFTGHEWLEADLSHLIYRKHLQPLFTSFERNAITYSEDMLERFSRLPNTVFCLDTNYLFSLRSQSKVTSLLYKNCHILPCISNRMSDYVAVMAGYADLKDRLGASLYRELCQAIRTTGVQLRRDFSTRPQASPHS